MSINKAILVGNVGKEPEVRYLEKNVAVANFTLATTERGYTMQNGTQVPDRTEWHNVVAWRNLAEIVEKYVRKGTQVYVEGKIQTRSWEKDGVKRYTTEIYAETIQLLGKRPEQAEVNGGTAPVAAVQASAEPPVMGAGEDDLPF
ncbi:MAG TPA: single-stranded DNA-binding protein [Paludibacteraceae bacterium]|nr:single-stranded DNA-binding protein [Paludibacteraceae bacterium]